jgi:hypothetical protein
VSGVMGEDQTDNLSLTTSPTAFHHRKVLMHHEQGKSRGGSYDY